MRTLAVAAPAKLNLFLHVTGRRPDGLHALESLFVALDLCDEIAVAPRADGAIVRTSGPAGVPPEADLAVRAAAALQRETGCAQGADIAVVKRIPLGAGLGGGSSDAASTLVALNRLWSLRLTRADLARIGFALGADVPFFLGDGPALARGAGERLSPMTLPRLWIALIVPSVNVPTAAIFAAPELTRNAQSAKMEVFSEGYGRNDLQRVAAARFPEVAAALASLRARTPLARMTGSGGGVFAPFRTEAEAREAVDACPGAMRGFVASTLARHPLAGLG